MNSHPTRREVLLQAEIVDDRTSVPAPARVAAGLLLAVVLVGLVAWIGTEFLM